MKETPLHFAFRKRQSHAAPTRRLNHMSSFVKLRKSLKKLKKRTDFKALDEARYVEIEISSIILRKFHAFILIVLTFLNVIAC